MKRKQITGEESKRTEAVNRKPNQCKVRMWKRREEGERKIGNKTETMEQIIGLHKKNRKTEEKKP